MNPYLRDPRDGAGSLLGRTGPITNVILPTLGLLIAAIGMGLKALARF